LFPDTLLLSSEQIQHYIIEASGLEPVDELQTTVSKKTMLTKRDIYWFVNNQDIWPQVENHPHVILTHNDYIFGSVHLTLRKPDDYPVRDNRWAEPSEKTRQAVEELKRQIHLTGFGTELQTATQTKKRTFDESSTSASRHFQELLSDWDAYYFRTRNSRFRSARYLPASLGFLYRTYLRIRFLGKALDAQNAFYHALAEHLDNTDRGNL
jgi:hypothetical protein